jgi:hypothetical protein
MFPHNKSNIEQMMDSSKINKLKTENENLKQAVKDLLFLHNTSERTLTKEWQKKVQSAKALIQQ